VQCSNCYIKPPNGAICDRRVVSNQAGSASSTPTSPLSVFVNEFAPGNISDVTRCVSIDVASGIHDLRADPHNWSRKAGLGAERVS
jgi:hypothetical protein